MKNLVLMTALTLFSTTGFSKETHSVCSSPEVANLANFNSGSPLVVRALSNEEANNLKSDIDDVFNCDEGVELLGPVKTNNSVVYRAQCAQDSLGIITVSFELTCKENSNN